MQDFARRSQAMEEAARSLGARHIHHEDFDMRGGVGPERSREIEDVVAAARREAISRS